MVHAPESIPPGAISVTNVRPAFEVSLLFGATHAELRAAGLTRASLADDNATIDAAATYRHMELMFGKPRFGEFLVAAARTHTLPSLGVLGLALKTVPTITEAMQCHQRFQHLTNRTARYDYSAEGDHVVVRESRFGEARPGSILISDYTMLIVAHLTRTIAAQEPALVQMNSRRTEIEPQQRDVLEAFLGAPIVLASPHASLAYPRALLKTPVGSADPELARYFEQLLSAAGNFDGEDEPTLLREVRLGIRDQLVQGTPTAAKVARQLGIGVRTLQRRLAELDLTFASVLESTRKTLAEGYLSEARLAVAEVAYLLGYREQASFYRAFRRWHGMTPAAYRDCR